MEDGPDGYFALGGDWVAIPPPRPLPDGPMPHFGGSDRGWLDQLVAFRDRAIANDLTPSPAADPRILAQMDPDARAAMETVGAAHDKFQADLAARFDAAAARATERFGDDAGGFLETLNERPEAFWGALDTLLYQRIGILEYHAPDIHAILRDVLLRFPERVWLPILAERIWPRLQPRKSDPLDQLLADWIAGPTGDFRRLETGAAKPAREDDLPEPVIAEMAARFGRQRGAFTAFKGLAGQEPPDTEAENLDRSTAFGRVLGGDLATEIEASIGQRGLSPGEAGLFKYDAYLHGMRQVAPGIPEGARLIGALSKRPYGFHGDQLHRFAPHAVWPYLACHLDILDRALGLAEPFFFEPKLEPLKTLPLLALLPKTPARFAEPLRQIANGRAKKAAETAKGLLARG